MDSPDARAHGYVNLARVYFEEGRLSDAATALTAAAKCDPPPPWWTLAWLNGLVNSQNAVEPADFDRAIRDFESILDPQNQPRERKFDFTKDYVVINQLGKSLFRRSQLEIENPIEQQRLLIRAIDAYQRTLALEPEDLDAHFGLSQCYARLAIDAVDWPDAIITEPTAEQLREMADLVIWPGADLVKRQQGVSQLAAWVEAYAKLPGTQPRLPLYRALSAILAPAFVTESDPLLRSGMANVLAKLHRESKAIYQPDEIAQSRTTSLYRAKHPEANHAAEAIVIYPTTEVQRQTILKRGTPTAANR